MWEECTPKCVSKKHADTIFSAIKNCGQMEDKIANYISSCFNVAINKDSLGRTALHVAASLGRIKTLQWLLLHGAQINAKDEESGFSALHRAFYFGQLEASKLLLDNNANLFNILDDDSMSAFDHLIQDRSYFCEVNPSLPCEVYVWGSNPNYTLGLEKQQSQEFPDLLDVFPKGRGDIKQVAMNKFHSVFLTSSGEAYSCGIGQGGKLGLGSEVTAIRPQKITLETDSKANGSCKDSKSVVSQAALGTNHTLLLTESGNVYSFGMNEFHQLGHNPPPSQLLLPRVISSFEDKVKGVVNIQGICSSSFHSVFWNSGAVYTCGLNAGALGHLKGERTLACPKKISLLNEKATIIHVAASDGATAVATGEGNVYVLHEYQCRKIASKQYDLIKIAMAGGKLDFVQEGLIFDSIPFQVILLAKNGNIFVWSEANPVLTRCIFDGCRQYVMRDVTLCKHSVAFVSSEGECFLGSLKRINPTKKSGLSSSNELIVTRPEYAKRNHVVHINTKRLPGICRATSIACDPLGKNFAVTHIRPSSLLGIIAQICPPPSQLQNELKQLLHNADPSDLTHDVVFHVESRSFAAHRFILSANCHSFYQNVCVSSSTFGNDGNVYQISDVPANIFELLLTYIYTGTCVLFEAQACAWKLSLRACTENLNIEKSSIRDVSKKAHDQIPEKEEKDRSDDVIKSLDILRIVQAYARKLGVQKLAEVLEKAISTNELVFSDRVFRPKTWNRSACKDLYDVNIQSEDGKGFRAHRAVLMARSDYFRSMFSYSWIESVALNKISLPIHSSVLSGILDYIYEDKATRIEHSEDLDWISNCLVVADLLLIPRLVTMCEASLVGLLTIKNCAKVFEFATMYNTTQLKKSCMYFMCYNLPSIIERRLWSSLSPDSMKELTLFYQQLHPRMAHRLPTTSISEDLVKEMLNLDLNRDSCMKMGLSSSVREREGKKKKLRRKSGKKEFDLKEHQQLLSSELKDDNAQAASQSKGEVWLKVDKSKKRNKPVDSEHSIKKEVSTYTSPETQESPCSKEEGHKSLVNNASSQIILRKDSPSKAVFESMENAAKQNSPTLFEVAKVVQTIASPESQKCKKFPKISQKQRKLQENIAASFVEKQKESQTSVDVTCSPVAPSAWGSPDKTKSTSALMTARERSESEETCIPLQHIIDNEQLQQRNLIKTNAKPLRLTLLEEKAIKELEIFYGKDDIDDEYIVVERVLPQMTATPVWSQKTRPSNLSRKKSSHSMSDYSVLKWCTES